MAFDDVLPDDVRALPLAEKITRLRVLCPGHVAAIEVIVDDCLEQRSRRQFYAGPRGALKRASRKGDGAR
jgi:hypothetical protein